MGDKKTVHLTLVPAQHKPNLPGGRALVKQSASTLLVLQYSKTTSLRETLSLTCLDELHVWARRHTLGLALLESILVHKL